jgi:fumarylpyruvate hydrolase
MTQTTYLRTPPAVQSLPVRGKAERLPVNRIFFVGRNDHAHAVEMGKDVEQSSVCSEIVPMPGVITDQGEIALRVNGQVKQKSDVNKLIWNVSEIIADLSLFYHLQPGDLIYTGTPEGVGAVGAGDRIEGHVEGVAGITLNVGPAE